MRKITKATIAGRTYHAPRPSRMLPDHACPSTIPRVDSVPDWMSTPTIARLNAAS
jgi:hypothetical protein